MRDRVLVFLKNIVPRRTAAGCLNDGQRQPLADDRYVASLEDRQCETLEPGPIGGNFFRIALRA